MLSGLERQIAACFYSKIITKRFNIMESASAGSEIKHIHCMHVHEPSVPHKQCPHTRQHTPINHLHVLKCHQKEHTLKSGANSIITYTIYVKLEVVHEPILNASIGDQEQMRHQGILACTIQHQ